MNQGASLLYILCFVITSQIVFHHDHPSSKNIMNSLLDNMSCTHDACWFCNCSPRMVILPWSIFIIVYKIAILLRKLAKLWVIKTWISNGLFVIQIKQFFPCFCQLSGDAGTKFAVMWATWIPGRGMTIIPKYNIALSFCTNKISYTPFLLLTF